MSQKNSVVYSKSNNLPPRSETRSNNLRSRPSRQSSQNRVLHSTLPNRSPSSSTIVHRRRNLSSRK